MENNLHSLSHVFVLYAISLFSKNCFGDNFSDKIEIDFPLSKIFGKTLIRSYFALKTKGSSEGMFKNVNSK